jgi:hypothetical protein
MSRQQWGASTDTSTAGSVMRLTFLTGLLKHLKGEIPPEMRREFLSKAEAHRRLMEISGESYPMESVDERERWVRQARRSDRRFFTKNNKNL